jgi:outer membrane protein
MVSRNSVSQTMQTMMSSSRARQLVSIACLGAITFLTTVLLNGNVAAQDLKVGYVNVPKVFDGYDRTKTYETGLEKKGQQKETELEGRMSELKKLRESLELLNDQARDAKVREIEEKADAIKRFRSNTARDLSRERDKMAGEILKEIQKAVEDYAKTNNFSFILDERSVLFGQPVYDVTAEVLKILNSRFAATQKH